jgi:hypothetical protein
MLAIMLLRVSRVGSETDWYSPFLSANDRSRWATVRVLGDFNTYEIDNVMSEPGWNTIDRVVHKGAKDGRLHSYSSKPPLLATLVTYEYLAIKSFTHTSIADEPYLVTYIVLFTFNVLPMLIICVLIALMAERFCETDSGKILVVGCACFGTYLTTFANTLNNHVPAALGVAIAIFALSRIWVDQSKNWVVFFIAGLSAAWAAANELPALSFLAVTLAATLIKSPTRAIFGTLLGAAVVGISFFCTNMIAHGSWIPPYAQRSDGAVIAELDPALETKLDEWAQHDGEFVLTPPAIYEAIKSNSDVAGFEPSDFVSFTVSRKTAPKRWLLYDHPASQLLVIAQTDEGKLLLKERTNWYEYPGSYWFDYIRKGIDLGEPSVGTYALHVLIGHHGIFSLTPIWLLALAGSLFVFKDAFSRDERHPLFWMVVAIVLISIVVVTFYIVRPQIDRNYGGMTCVLRWLLWLAPLWLVCIIPIADRITQSTLWKTIAWILVILSFASSLYAFSNPWTLPWFYNLMLEWKWIQPY